MSKLSNDLLPIYRFELDNGGNEVARIDEPSGTTCPYAVVFKKPLNKVAIEGSLDLLPSVKYWECRDPHYPNEAGYYSETTRHALAGPIAQ